MAESITEVRLDYQITDKNSLESFISSHWNEINTFLDTQMDKLPVPIYSSVDIRESTQKFAPVDHNMYPAGFNNLCQLDLDASGKLFRKAIHSICDSAKTIAIIPEGHTKNTFYLDNLVYLSKILIDEGFIVHFVGLDQSLFEDNKQSLSLISHSQFDLVILKGEIKEGLLKTDKQIYDFAILNNDQSSPLQVQWGEVRTPIHPTPLIGWFNRQKVKHFSYYKKVIEQFSSQFSIDPNLLQAKFRRADQVDFSSKEGLEKVSLEVDELLKELPENSKVFVKASQGTYGMGISVVGKGEEILNMNRKSRNKMDKGKNKIKFTSLLIQEGVESIVEYEKMAAEVAIYLINGKPVGGFVRANSQKGPDANLNSKGMIFRKYCISEIKENNDAQSKEAVYSIVARLATWASALEIKEVKE